GVTLTVSSGATAAKAAVGAGGILVDAGHTVSATVKGAVVSSKTVNATESVTAKAIASATTVDSGGLLLVSSGGTAVGAVLSGGAETVQSGGVVSGAVIFKGTGDTLSVAGGKSTALSISGFAKT